MNFDFIPTTNIQDYLPAIEGKPEFIVVEKDWYDVINYVVSTAETFQDPNEVGISDEEKKFRILRKDCRGIKFYKDGSLAAKPYHKFHNLNERAETQAHLIDWNKPFIILEKLDGSMVHPLFNKDYFGFRLMTKMGITDTSMLAEEFYAENFGTYQKFFTDMYEMNQTPLFEWVSPRSRIVDYPENNLILTGVRDNHLGKYMSYEKLENIGTKYNIPIVKFHFNSNKIESFIETMKDFSGIEGFVIRFADGHMVKLKTIEYLLKHKSKEIVSKDRNVFELILNDQIDDVMPFLDQNDREKVERLEIQLVNYLTQIKNEIHDEFQNVKHLTPKEFALNRAKQVKHYVQSGIFLLFKDPNANMYEFGKQILQKVVSRDITWETFLSENNLKLK